MTPAVKLLQKKKVEFVIHEYDHDPAASSFGEETVEKLNLRPDVIFKTLIAEIDGKHLAVGAVPVSKQLDLKLFAKAVGFKKARMADKELAEKITGYIPGGISPIGMKKRLKTIIDTSAKKHKTIFVSGGRRGLQIELAPDDLADLISAEFKQITR